MFRISNVYLSSFSANNLQEVTPNAVVFYILTSILPHYHIKNVSIYWAVVPTLYGTTL